LNAIEVRGVTKTYRRYERFRFRALELATLGLSRHHRAHHSLRNVDLDVAKGEALGVIGENGCGKSTLLKVMAGVCHPELGSVRVRGRVASLLELGSGFHPHFTGRDNAVLQAALHGLSPAESRTVLPFIEDFAGIGDAFDDLLRTYSSGMVVRLAFAAAVAVEPDILLVDEALAVGDEDFQRRCLDRMLHFKEQGRTIVFVTHSLHHVLDFCTRAVLLEQGRLALDGAPDAVCAEYLKRVDQRAAAARVQR
jgi:ABC-type polysaccharide/polyol phosphate transport system ATPase subunit